MSSREQGYVDFRIDAGVREKYRTFINSHNWAGNAAAFAKLVSDGVVDGNGVVRQGPVSPAVADLINRVVVVASSFLSFSAQGLVLAARDTEEQEAAAIDDDGRAGGGEVDGRASHSDVVLASPSLRQYVERTLAALTSKQLKTMKYVAKTTVIPAACPYVSARWGREEKVDASVFHQSNVQLVDPEFFFGVRCPCPTRGWAHARFTRRRGHQWVYRFVRQPGLAGSAAVLVLASRRWVCAACVAEKAELQSVDNDEHRNIVGEFRAWDRRVMGYYRDGNETAFIPNGVYAFDVYKKTALPLGAVHLMSLNAATTLSASALSSQWKEQAAWNSEMKSLSFYSLQLLLRSQLGRTISSSLQQAPFQPVLLDVKPIVDDVGGNFIRDSQVSAAPRAYWCAMYARMRACMRMCVLCCLQVRTRVRTRLFACACTGA
jgi:hypothetical protein